MARGFFLLPEAKAAKSRRGLLNVLGRAQTRAALWARLLADWPALVEIARRDADAVEALYEARVEAAQ